MELVAEIGGPIPAVNYDRLTVQGAITVGGSLEVMLTGGYVPAPGQSFMLIDNQGTLPIAGTFAGLPEGGLFTAGGVTFRGSYVGGTGNDFVITPVPEPGSILLAALGGAAFAWRRRRR